MELTAENQDSMDARPLGRETGVAPSPRIEKLVAARQAKKGDSPTNSLRPMERMAEE